MSAISNSPRQFTPLTVEARKSFSLGVWFKTADEEPLDLTGCTLTFVLARSTRSSEVLVTKQLTVQADIGRAQLVVQSSELDLKEGSYPYSITLKTSDGYSSVVVKGELEVMPNSNPELGPAYEQTGAPQSLVVKLVEGKGATVKVDYLTPPKISVGSVTTLEPGTPAGATFEGTWPHQTLHLSLPQGPRGFSGEGATIALDTDGYYYLTDFAGQVGSAVLIDTDGMYYIP